MSSGGLTDPEQDALIDALLEATTPGEVAGLLNALRGLYA